MYSIEEFDKEKSKVLKYVLYKKRSKQEVKNKFYNTIDSQMLEDIIDELEENGYIDDNNYIERAISEFMALKNLSIKEIKYKLFAKGLNSDIIDEYISNHNDELNDYEIQSIKNIFYKKQTSRDEEDIKQMLLKKGYKLENIKEALSEVK